MTHLRLLHACPFYLSLPHFSHFAFSFQVEEAIDGWFKRCSSGEDVTGLGRSSGLRMGRSRPVIPPLLELHLIQLGNKVRRNDGEERMQRHSQGWKHTLTDVEGQVE